MDSYDVRLNVNYYVDYQEMFMSSPFCVVTSIEFGTFKNRDAKEI